MKKKRNKITYLSVFAVLIVASLVGVAFTGCDQQGKDLVQLVLKEIAQERSDSIDGFLGTVKIFSDEADGRKLTPIGEPPATRRITIENPGTADLIINDLSVYLQVYDSATEEMTGEYFQDIFKIVEGTKPDLPLVIPPGGSFSSLYVSFSPVESGETTGVLSLETNAGENFFRLWGNGAWRLDLEVTSGDGRIVEPIKVEDTDGQKTYYATQEKVTLTAETGDELGLVELQQWVVADGAAVFEGDPEMLSVVVVLSGNAEVEAQFWEPYVFVREGASGDGTKATPYGSIEDGVGDFNGDPQLKGICVAAGTYTIPSDQEPNHDVLFRGGYNAAFDDRDIANNTTTINTGTNSLVFPAAASSDSFLEGFTIIGETIGNIEEEKNFIAVYVKGSDLTIRSNTITGPVNGCAIGIESDADGNHADPIINNNIIYGADGNPSDNYFDLRSIGIYVNDYSDPTIKENTIIAGNPTSDNDESINIEDIANESIAIYVDWFSNPVIDGNTLIAGNATGARGKSIGIYSVNSSSPIIKNNTISAGYGGSVSYALYFSYGGWPVIDNNIMFTPPDGEQDKYGMYIGPSARIDSMTRNNLYEFPEGFALIYTEDRILTTIQELNDRWVPENSGFEEPDNYSEEP